MPRCQKKEHCVHWYNVNKKVESVHRHISKHIRISKLLYYCAEKCVLLQTLASVLSWDVMCYLSKILTNQNSTWTGTAKWVQSIIMFTWYRSGDWTAENNTNNMLKLTDSVKKYVGLKKKLLAST